MDFHSLTRRALQSLCKKNKIQANMTNVAMADALKALPAVEGLEEFQESQLLLSSKKEKKAPEPQGSPLPRSRRVTARAPQEVSKLAASEEEGKEDQEKTAGASTTRRRTRRQPTTTTKAGDVDVGTRRTTRRRAASNMAALRAEEEEEEEEEAEDVVENVVSSDQSTEGMETKEGEGKQETNRMLPVVEQPKEVQKEEEEEEEEEAEFSDGGIQGVEKEHTVVLSEEEAAKFSNGGIQVVVEHTTVPNDELGVEAAEMNAEISMIDQNRDSEEEEEAAEMNAEISMVELSVDVPAAATDQTSQVSLVDPSDDGLSPAELVQGDGLSSGESEELAAEFATTEENEQSSNGDDADHAAAAADKFVEEESSEAAEISSKTNEEGPDGSYSTIGVPLDMGDFVDELGGDSAIDVPVEVEDLVPGHLTGEVAGEAATSPAKEVSTEEENKQASNGDNTDHASAGGGGDDDGFASEISDENEKADDAKEEETEQYNGEDTTTEEEELETTNDSGGGDSAIEVPVQIEDFGDEDVVVSGLLVGEIAVEAATTPSSPVNIDPVPLSDDADNNNNNNNNKENENENADQPEPGRNGVDGLRKAKLENLSLRKLKAIYKDTLLVINKNKGEEKKRSALQALDENCLSLK